MVAFAAAPGAVESVLALSAAGHVVLSVAVPALAAFAAVGAVAPFALVAFAVVPGAAASALAPFAGYHAALSVVVPALVASAAVGAAAPFALVAPAVGAAALAAVARVALNAAAPGAVAFAVAARAVQHCLALAAHQVGVSALPVVVVSTVVTYRCCSAAVVHYAEGCPGPSALALLYHPGFAVGSFFGPHHCG